MGGRVLAKFAIAVAEQDSTVTVLVKGDSLTPVPVAQFDGFPQSVIPGPTLIGAAGRLWAANQARQGGTVKGKWPVELVDATATRFAMASLGARRAAALDTLALGMGAWGSQLQLAASELTWYRAWAAALSGDLPTLLSCLEALPPTGYTTRVPLLLRQAGRLQADPALAARASRQLAPFVASSLDAQALLAVLAPQAESSHLDLARSFAERVERIGGHPASSLQAVPAAIAGGKRLPALPPIPVTALPSFDAYLAGLAGSSLDAVPAALGALPVVLLDELITRRALTRIPPGPGPWPPAVTAYLRSRLDPGQAELAELEAVGFTAEIARRHFLAGDETRLAALPADDPAVRHYQTLHTYRRSGRLADPDGLRPAARTVLELVEALRQPGQDGRREAPEELVADASCWPLVRDLAYRGELSLTDELRSRYPEFGAWLDLCGMQRLVFEGRWTEVISTGGQLAAASQLESLRDEAQSMVAFAQWQLGRPAEALRVLDEALAGQFTTGLVVNAALVAAEQGCLPALPYLAKAMRMAADPRVRQGAVSRAIGLWLGDKEVQDYPAPLAQIVREALATPQVDDDFHETLVVVSAIHDKQWLAGATLRAANNAQAEALRYFVTRARVVADGYRESFDDVARVLIRLWHANPRLPWVEREKTWLTELLMDVVHTPFGEASGVLSVVEILVNGNILTLADELILSLQAGAHVACKISDDGGEIALEAEQRLIHAHVRKYWARLAELSESDREVVGDEVARCVVVSAVAFAVSAERAWEEFGRQWDQLVQRERWDYQNRPAIIGMERHALNVFDTYIARCRAYLKSMEGLPLDENGAEQRDLIISGVGKWATETARLRSLLY
jgi:hypothetical protein